MSKYKKYCSFIFI